MAKHTVVIVFALCMNLALAVRFADPDRPYMPHDLTYAPTNRHLLEFPEQDIPLNGACQAEIQDYCGMLTKENPASKTNKKSKDPKGLKTSTKAATTSSSKQDKSQGAEGNQTQTTTTITMADLPLKNLQQNHTLASGDAPLQTDSPHSIPELLETHAQKGAEGHLNVEEHEVGSKQSGAKMGDEEEDNAADGTEDGSAAELGSAQGKEQRLAGQTAVVDGMATETAAEEIDTGVMNEMYEDANLNTEEKATGDAGPANNGNAEKTVTGDQAGGTSGTAAAGSGRRAESRRKLTSEPAASESLQETERRLAQEAQQRAAQASQQEFAQESQQSLQLAPELQQGSQEGSARVPEQGSTTEAKQGLVQQGLAQPGSALQGSAQQVLVRFSTPGSAPALQQAAAQDSRLIAQVSGSAQWPSEARQVSAQQDASATPTITQPSSKPVPLPALQGDQFPALVGRYTRKRASRRASVFVAARQGFRTVLSSPHAWELADSAGMMADREAAGGRELQGQRELAWHPKNGKQAALAGNQKVAVQRISGLALKVLQALRVQGVRDGQVLPPAAPIARCLKKVVRLGQTSISPDAPQVSESCVDELRSYLVKRSAAIPLQLSLWVTCAYDLNQRCSQLLTPKATAAELLGCLKDHKAALALNCKEAVTHEQIESAADPSLDPELNAGCGGDRARLCSDAGWGGGHAMVCLQRYLLRKEHPHLTQQCHNALFKRMMQDSENIRFDYHLASACAADKQALCTDVSPEDGAVFECLSAEKEGVDISDTCRAALEQASLWRALDVRLHFRFRQVCSSEVKRLCNKEELLLLHDTTGPLGKAGPVFECMRQQVRNLTDVHCGQLVHKILVAGFTDNRLDTLFQQVCGEEAAMLCKSQPNQVVCLMERSQDGEELSARCSTLVNNRLQQAASDIDFNPHLRDKCLLERSKFCDYSDITGGAVIDCLVDSRQNAGFGAVCRQAVGEYLVSAMSDIRMLHTLREACAEDLRVLCKDVEPGQGKLLLCLQRRRGHIQSGGCKMQLLRVIGLQADDHRLHHQLSKACKSDVQKFCANVPQGGGLIHKCLRQHEAKLSTECRQHEHELEQAEHEDARINPQIRKSCGVAVALFCGDVQPGDAGVLTCLRGNMGKPDFPSECQTVLKEQLNRAAVKFSLNKELREACEEDVAEECEEEEGKGDDAQMTCLAGKMGIVSGECRAQLLAMVKLQLSVYRMGMPLTAACDGDVMTYCQIDKLSLPLLARGYVQSCLVKHAAELHRPCWEAISAFDDGQQQHAKELEIRHWNQQLPQGQLDKVVAEVRSNIEPRLTTSMMQHVSGLVEKHQESLRPKLRAIVVAMVMLALGTMSLMFALLKWRRRRGPLVLKDGKA